MANETRNFGLATLLTLVGLGVMLWGVSLNYGAAFNQPIVLGGVIIAAGIGIIVVSVMRLEESHEGH